MIPLCTKYITYDHPAQTLKGGENTSTTSVLVSNPGHFSQSPSVKRGNRYGRITSELRNKAYKAQNEFAKTIFLKACKQQDELLQSSISRFQLYRHKSSMYIWSLFSADQPDVFQGNCCSWSALNRENPFCPVPVRVSEFGFARWVRPSRLALARPFSTPRLNLLRAYSRDSSHFPRRRPHNIPSSSQSRAGYAVSYRWRSLPKVRRHIASNPEGSLSNECRLFRYHHGPCHGPFFPHTHHWHVTNTCYTECI